MAKKREGDRKPCFSCGTMTTRRAQFGDECVVVCGKKRCNERLVEMVYDDRWDAARY